MSHEQDIQSRPATGSAASPQKQKILLSMVLAVATVVLYYPADSHPFVNFDDNLYVSENAHVTSGLHWSTVKWAFTTFDEGNWHPLTWLSHAADCQLYGLNPAGHHDTNLVLHALNVVLLFWVLQQATGYVGRNAMVAALFALHPINVETVVWIAERKNLLSMTFFLLALGAYRRYTVRPAVSRYIVVALLYALGLMAKPQIITFPFVLLLWDYWPLQRISFAGRRPSAETQLAYVPQKAFSQLVTEKVPLFAITAASAAITVKAQCAGRVVRLYPLAVRLENAVVAYASYVKKAFWPLDLAPMYPHPGDAIARWQFLAALALLLAITALAVSEGRRRYLGVGWLWFLGTLVPMIGVVQVGTQAMADRYAYLPLIGVFIMFCWSVADWGAQRRVSTTWIGSGAIALLLVLAWMAHQQIAYWEDNVTLWTRTLQVTRNNWVAQDNLGGALMEQGKLDAAISHFRAAAAIYPGDPVSHLDIGFYEQQHNNWSQAIQQYQEVLNATPSPKLRAEAYNNLALIERDLGDYASARQYFRQAVDISPRYVGAWVGLGLASQKTGDLGAAIQAYSRAAEIQPSDLSYALLAQALNQAGREEESRTASQQARSLSRNFAETERSADYVLTQWAMDRTVPE